MEIKFSLRYCTSQLQLHAFRNNTAPPEGDPSAGERACPNPERPEEAHTTSA